LGRQHFAIDGELLVQIGHFITRHTHHTLDVVHRGFGGVTKNHHVAALHGRALSDLDVGHRQTDTVMEFVHEDQITNVQSRDHRTGRNLEWLKQK
jgi:hypothetical protein